MYVDQLRQQAILVDQRQGAQSIAQTMEAADGGELMGITQSALAGVSGGAWQGSGIEPNSSTPVAMRRFS